MLRSILILAALGPLFCLSAANADPWKDESGHGKRWKSEHWKEDRGETPWWGRGKGYWDGHFKHGYRAYRPPVYYYEPVPQHYYYEPAPPTPYYYDAWHGPEYRPY